LLDVVWYHKKTGHILLGVESEWHRNKGQVLDDFEKLLNTKAPLKLLIFSTDEHEKEYSEMLEEVRKYLDGFRHHLNGEQYLLVEFANKLPKVYPYLYSIGKGRATGPKCLTPPSLVSRE